MSLSTDDDRRGSAIRLLAPALGLTLVLSACGDGGGDDVEAAPPAGTVAAAAEDAEVDTDTDTDADGIDTETDGTDNDDGDTEEMAADAEQLAEDVAADATEMAEDMRDDLEEQQSAEGGGSATLTVGDQTWTFDSVLCAIGEEETGQEGAEFVLSSIQDGLQFYVSIDSFGHSVSLHDVDDFVDPSVSMASMPGDFIELDGTSVSGETTMIDDLTMDMTEATFEGVCP